MKILHNCFVFGLILAGCSPDAMPENQNEFQLPQKFEITRFADDSLASDIYKLTFDSQGRVLVAGPGYIKRLYDTNRDGKADSVSLISRFPEQGARGMYVDGQDLIVSGDQGVWRLPGFEDLDPANPERELLLSHEGRGDHNANSLIKGPDGWLYLITGDYAGIGTQHANLAGSPVKEPVQGALLRISPDGDGSEVLAHGFRNPYDVDINTFGHFFTYDADGERVLNLPWYVPSRVYDIAPGMLHGWIFAEPNYWNPLPHFFDHTEPLTDTWRGSPTGIAVYRHNAFPENYKDGLFLADWSYGRIYFIPLEKHGSSYRGEPEVFLQVTGSRGFAITDMNVGPNGDLFVTIGGRGTRGGVYRIRYTGERGISTRQVNDIDPLREVLTANQPLSSWSRSQWVPNAKMLGKNAFNEALLDENLPVRERIRAAEILVELFDGIDINLARQVSNRADADEKVVARVVWAVSRSLQGHEASEFLAEMTQNTHPWIAREVWEAVGRSAGIGNTAGLSWLIGFDSHDRRVRAAAYKAALGNARENFLYTVEITDPATPRQWLGYLYSHGPESRHAHRLPEGTDWQSFYFTKSMDILNQATDTSTQIDALRLIQIGLGDIHLIARRPDVNDGYKATNAQQVRQDIRMEIAEGLAQAFPSGVPTVDHEIARLAAMLEVEELPDGFLASLSSKWTDTSPVEQDIHYLLATMRLPGERTPIVTEKVADALVNLHIKMKRNQLEPSRYWPGRIRNMLEQHLGRDPDLAVAIATHPDLRLADHSQLAEALPEPYKTRSADTLLQAAQEREKRGEQALTPGLIEFLSVLPPDELLPMLRRHRHDPALKASILSVFSNFAEEEDRPFLIEALSSRQTVVVTRAVEALQHLSGTATVDEQLKALRSLAGNSRRSKMENAIHALSDLLHQWTGSHPDEVSEADSPEQILNGWMGWFTGQYPEEVSELMGAEEEREVFGTRLEGIDWDAGSAGNGKQIFIELACQACHVDAGRIGPDLQGITLRFDPPELMRIINNPDQIQWDAFRATEILTSEGKVYTGILIYDSPDVSILQTPDRGTIHFSGEEVQQIRDSSGSLMPGGLLQELSEQELADLHSYLETF